jgi:importin subunit beta-1
LLSLLLECIQKVNIEGEDDDDEEWGVALSSGCCLASVAQVIGNAVMEPVVRFVSAHI